jgi:hypothetical protein
MGALKTTLHLSRSQRAQRLAAVERRQEAQLARGLSKGKKSSKPSPYATSDRDSTNAASKAAYYD